MWKCIVLGITVLLICIGFIGSVQSAEKVVTMELSSFMPTTDKMQIMLQEWAAEVGKRTNGRVKINVHPGATLTPPAQTFDSVENEVIDIGYGPMGVTTGRFPMLEVMDLPFGFKSGYNASVVATELVKKFRPKEMAKVKLLFMVSSPPANLQTKKPIKSVDEMKGMKLRSLGGMTVKYIEAIGAVPVVLAPTDVYDGLSKGVIDGAIVISDALTTLKWGDMLKYTTNLGRNSYANNGYLVMNLKKWNSLPADVKQIIDKLDDEYLAKMSKLWDQKEQDAIATLKSQGHTYLNLSPQEEEKWAKRLAPLTDFYIKDKTPKGVPAADVVKFVQDWIKKNQK